MVGNPEVITPMNILAEQRCRRKANHCGTYDPCLTFANPAVTIARLRCENRLCAPNWL
jgi:hypothetical protein